MGKGPLKYCGNRGMIFSITSRLFTAFCNYIRRNGPWNISRGCSRVVGDRGMLTGIFGKNKGGALGDGVVAKLVEL